MQRLAGGLPPDLDVAAQHLTLTSMSSLLALFSAVVYPYKTTKLISDDLAKAFRSIRIVFA